METVEDLKEIPHRTGRKQKLQEYVKEYPQVGQQTAKREMPDTNISRHTMTDGLILCIFLTQKLSFGDPWNMK